MRAPSATPSSQRQQPLPPGGWVIIAAEPITDMDTTACDVLVELVGTLDSRNIHLVFAELKDPVRDKLQRYRLDDPLATDRLYPTLNAAVAACQQTTGKTWEVPSEKEPTQ